ncbi:hypothetical protein TIFTF001_041890 [Ficus carica]|uniref:Uncharacterized protein n=1 Tax=Ficus carica TaxID=3494 RepID=A0AA88CVJ0_FICCA|nr:hypothetical protein TIFTF001_041890 [Ficus carica]
MVKVRVCDDGERWVRDY